MKTSLKTVLFVAFAALGVPAAFAAPENHEEFARQYMPESQAIFERFRKNCAETKKLRDALAEDLRVMNRPTVYDAGHCALCEKIDALEFREAEWAALIKDAFFKHKAAMATSEQLAAADAALAKNSLAWENRELKPMLKSVALFSVPLTIKIPGRNYAFGKYEVTQREYNAVMGKNPSHFSRWWCLPVEMVSWHDATAFCKKLTERERAAGRISATQRYRLPTKDEWVHACRAGTTKKDCDYTIFSHADLARAGWYEGNSRGTTHPVGQKESNAFGLYDMQGNVWEWTETIWKPTRPSYLTRGVDYVIGGGGYDGDWFDCRSSNTSISDPGWRRKNLGFRVVLDPAE
ncbi:MAG: formylglycine-generating enzyme family protein [Candidatus Spyradosoma sp.]